MNRADDEHFADALSRLRPRRVSAHLVERIAEQLEVDKPASHHTVRRRTWTIAAACAAVLLVIASSVVWRWQSDVPNRPVAVEGETQVVGPESPLPLRPTSYAVLRRALAESPESLMARLDESVPHATIPSHRVWRIFDHELTLEEQIP